MMFEFRPHNNMVGKHAILSPSKYHWVNYESDEQLMNMIRAQEAATRGTRIHAFAAEAIRLGIYLNKRSNDPVNLYVNDAIKFKLTPEQPLVFTDNAFGTADAIGYQLPTKKANGLLTIFDLKTGTTPANMLQLHLYAALFFLEYGIDPQVTDVETRIYQTLSTGESVLCDHPTAEQIEFLMDRLIECNNRIEDWRITGDI